MWILMPLFQPPCKFHECPIPVGQPVFLLFIHLPESRAINFKYGVVSETCASPNLEVNGTTFGEMNEEEKNRLSHRYAALIKFAEWLK